MANDLHIAPKEYEIIEGFLEDSLSKKEEIEFKNFEANDPDWNQKIEEVKFLKLGLENYLFKEEIEKIHQENFNKLSNKPKINSFWPLAIAASILFLLIAGASFLGLFQNKNERLFEAYYETDPGLITAMSGSESYEFDRGMVDFKSGNFNEALQFWEPLLEADSSQDTLVYFVAMAKLELEKYEQSEDLLTKFVNGRETEFNEEARWYLALLYLKKGEIEKAKSLLMELQKPDAKTLLEELK
jgi:tetratricopeptide (TPR) repeat protein